MYSLQAHDGSVTALTYSASYVISLGTDERLCVWERFQGHLLNTIQVVSTVSLRIMFVLAFSYAVILCQVLWHMLQFDSELYSCLLFRQMTSSAHFLAI